MTEAKGEYASQKLKKVMVFCDGTWCGQLTGTETNVKILADAIAGERVKTRVRFESQEREIVGCYFDGEGVQGDFSDYLLDGALGGKIREDCLEAYKFIIKEFEANNGRCEAWLIGLSRGSYTVRCIGGMINNCGLISRNVITESLGRYPSEEDMEEIIQRAYHYYRDRSDTYIPNSDYMKQWKENHSRKTKRPPVKFMGLFETVGSLGIPSLNPGMGVDYYGELNFYGPLNSSGKQDEGASAVSGEVERVYQALAVHDRLTVFMPCHVKRDKLNEDFFYNRDLHLNIAYETEELWFPGAHYDIGRQHFMFYKSPPLLPDLQSTKITTLPSEILKRLTERGITFCLTRLLRIPEIYPNYRYSDNVLFWMIGKMATTDCGAFGTLREVVEQGGFVTRTRQESLTETLFNWLTLKPAPLHSDAYDHLVDKTYLTIGLVPFAHRFLVSMFNRYLLMDRTIVDPPPAIPPAVPPPPVKFYGPDQYLEASTNYRSRSWNSWFLEREI